MDNICPICGQYVSEPVVACPDDTRPQHRCPPRVLAAIDSARGHAVQRVPTFGERLEQGFAMLEDES